MVVKMYKDDWNRFMRTGQINDYLAYKGHPIMENAKVKAGDVRELGYAGVRTINRDDNQIRADR